MIIPQNLSQFKNQHLLLLVAGKQDMHIYEVQNDSVEQAKEFKIPSPRFSDDERRYNSRSGPGHIRSYATREITDDEIIAKFISELKKQIKDFHPDDFDRVYIFAPSQIKNRISEALPASFKKKVDAVIEGNYCSDGPLVILSKISQAENKDGGTARKKSLPLKPEARKILKKSNQARKVIKGKADYSS